MSTSRQGKGRGRLPGEEVNRRERLSGADARAVAPLRVPPLRGTATGGPPERAGDDARTASAANVFAGAWLLIAPWVLGYSAAAARWNDVACGAAIGVLAFARLAGAPRLVWLSLCNAAIATWLVVASFTLDGGGTEFANDVILGALIALLALLSAASSESAAAAHRAPKPSVGTLPPPGVPSAARRRSPSPPSGARPVSRAH